MGFGSYEESLSGLYSLDGKLSSRQYLVGMRKLLSKLGNPERDFESIIITGTNGKGSATAMAAAALQESGLKTGLYLSPHIDDFRERISINGEWVGKKRFVEVYEAVKRAAGQAEPVTLFEFATSMCFEYFSEERVDCAVLEVGLGGRLDATNVARSRLGAITSVGLEHTEVLGKTLGKIAFEKAGIARSGGIIVTAEDKPEPLRAIRKECLGKETELIRVIRASRKKKPADAVSFKTIKCTSFGNEYLISGLRGEYFVSLSMLGEHQGANAAVAAGLAEAFGAGPKAIENGISKAKLPCRLEVVSRNPLVIMDCAHNPHAAKALAKSLSLFDYERLILVAGMMQDKDHGGFFKELAPLADTVILNQPGYARAAPLSELFKAAGKHCKKTIGVKDVECSLSVAREIAGPDDLICVAGSIYMLSQARGNPPGVSQ